MWIQHWRNTIWADIAQEWDLIIVGGGITGAGILREAARLGLRALLVEQADFASGTSSRSSKLVHGGLRYLKEGKIRLTRDAVREREQLLQDAPGLVEPLDFLLATYDGEHPGRLVYTAGLTIYDLLALRWSHRYYSAQDFRLMAGQLTPEGLEGGFRYGDAQTDDARLVLRVIREAVRAGATAINYTRAENLIRKEGGRVVGVNLKDLVLDREATVSARLVVNACGAWADDLRVQSGKEKAIRPLRGSHLIFPAWRLPVAQAVSFLHPLDKRPVFLLPWEGVTLLGTTDEDHSDSLDCEPHISGPEVAYLMHAVTARYPGSNLGLEDIIATFAGVRPVIGSGRAKSSEESRDHVIWHDNGLLTVTGGKLTTFRLIAEDVLREAGSYFEEMPAIETETPILDPVPALEWAGSLGNNYNINRLLGRYGSEAGSMLNTAQPGELEQIPLTNYLWAELRWAARAEGVVHLEDLLLRRVRLGLLRPDGGTGIMTRIRSICQPELGWNDSRWREEEEAYLSLRAHYYGLPPRDTIPSWEPGPRAASQLQISVRKEHDWRIWTGVFSATFVVLLASLTLLFSRRLLRRPA
ncbi:MAG: glycerol-3-phosphate dehydrogenase/oxidase [Candidatus Promineifilaceae bacterium]